MGTTDKSPEIALAITLSRLYYGPKASRGTYRFPFERYALSLIAAAAEAHRFLPFHKDYKVNLRLLQQIWSRREAIAAILVALTAAPRLTRSATEQVMMMKKAPVVRVSILRCKPERFLEFERMMSESARILLPGIQAMHGCRGYFAGSDQATSSLSNVSIWETLEDAKQMERFQPMLDLGKRFLDSGATFERPIMNYRTLWQSGNDE